MRVTYKTLERILEENPEYVFTIEKIFSKEDAADLRQEEFVEKVKESWKKMRNCLATKDIAGMQIGLSNIEIYMGNLISKIRQKDIRFKNNTEYIAKLIGDRNTAETINRKRGVKIRELELEVIRLTKAIGLRNDSSIVMNKRLSKICKAQEKQLK